MEGTHNGEQWEERRPHNQSEGNAYRRRAEEWRQRANQARIEGDTEDADRSERIAEGEDALGEFEERYAAAEHDWLEEGWRGGIHWGVVAEVQDETAALEREVVLEGEDPLNVDRLKHSTDPGVERGLRVTRHRLGQFQKLRWRVEIMAELGQEIIDAEAAGRKVPDHGTGISRTAGAWDYRDEMLAKWRKNQGE